MTHKSVCKDSGFQWILWIFVMMWFLSGSSAYGQFPTKTQSFVLSPSENNIQLDLLTLPESVVMLHADTLISSEYYRFSGSTGTLEFNWPRHWPSFPVEVIVSWRYRPLSVQMRYQVFDRSELALFAHPVDTISSDYAISGEFYRRNPSTGFGINSNLTSRGSISRGIIVGSNRDLGLESGLRFELTGPITDDVTITAVLSDQNSLIQPDGSTQALREFDQVYIRLDASRSTIQLGDTDVNLNQSEIVRLNRRIQGADVQMRPREETQITTAAAILRGTYQVNEFQGRQGVQGPYRLTGTNSELFVMVVAGTERVYLDGRLLTRGEEHDYIIDYSIGELFFSSKRLVRATDRIRVEFQYLSNSYNRSLLATEIRQNKLAGGRLTLGVSYIREADNTFLDDAGMLREADLDILRNAGGNRSQMRTSGADSVGFRADAPYILYTRVDTIFGGQQLPVYVHQPGNPNGVWRVQFTRVEPGRGSYRRAAFTTNGIVYEWVGAGGDYEPFRQLESPQMRQVIAVNADVRVNAFVSLYTELGASYFDVNRLSESNASESDYMTVNRIRLRNVRLRDNLVLGGYVNHTHKGAAFQFFDPVREVEFDRNWGINPAESDNEQQFGGGLELASENFGALRYDIQQLTRSSQRGIRQTANVALLDNRYPVLDFEGSYLNTENSFSRRNTEWGQLRGSVSQGITLYSTRLTPFYQISAEKKQDRETDSAPLLEGSLAYVESEPGVQIQFSDRFQVAASIGNRDDYGLSDGQLRRQYVTRARNLDIGYTMGSVWTTRTRLAQQLRQMETGFQNGATEQVSGLALRSENNLQFLNQIIQGSLLYDVSTQSRSVLQETYLEVGPEFGQYVWRDLNNDGIRQIDEFFPELTPNEGTYIRQLLPSDDLLPVIVMIGSASLRIDASRNNRMQPASGLLGWGRSNLAYEIRFDVMEQNKSTRQQDIYLLNPDAFLSRENTLSGRYGLVQRLDLLRGVQRYNLSLEHEQREGLSQLAAGTEYSKDSGGFADFSIRYSDDWRIRSRAGYQNKMNTSSEISSREYNIRGWFSELGVQLERQSGVSGDIRFRGSRRIDVSQEQKITLQAYQVEQSAFFRVAENMQFQYRIEYRRMLLGGSPTPLGEFEITDGAGRGGSWLWSGRIVWRSVSNVRTTLQYDGRTGNDIAPIHTIRIAASATF